MELITLYLDKKTSIIIQQWILSVAEVSGNDYMITRHIPAHLTLLSFETKHPNRIVEILRKSELNSFEIDLVGLLSFKQRVLAVNVVYNQELYDLQNRLYQAISAIDDVQVSRYYQPFSYIPHITVAKKMENKQIVQGFERLNHLFYPVHAKVIRIGLSKVNPYEDQYIQELE